MGRRLRKAARAYTAPDGAVEGRFEREGGGVMRETVINYLNTPERPECMPTISVTLEPGDFLYIPFGWWHEVHSLPDESRGGMCASISHFYHPYYCRLGGRQTTGLGPLIVHPKYRSHPLVAPLVEAAVQDGRLA